jgi:triacylglycerol lipase
MLASVDVVWVVVAVLALIVGVYGIRLAAVRRQGSQQPIDGPTPPTGSDSGDSPVSSKRVSTLDGTVPGIVLERPAPTRYPLVFVHGWMGFDTIGLPGMRQEYFRGVRACLSALGYSVVFVRVSPAAGIERRATQLAEHLVALGAPRVNIVAHSMGGLDARFAIARLGLSNRVASLTTIGTPHRGTPLADTTRIISGSRAVRRALSAFGVEGICDLTTRQMNDFNVAVADAPGVAYASVIGSVPEGSLAAVHAMLAPGYAYLLKRAGDNDGMVPAASQPWGEVFGEVEADHWAQIGWSGGFDTKAFYVSLAERLSRRGL